MRAPIRIAVLAAVAVAVLVSVNCGRQLNPSYCSKYPDDPDCQLAGLGGIDAPSACNASSCTDKTRPVCVMTGDGSGACVQCTAATDCPTDRPNCVNNVCRGCLQDSDCMNNDVCLNGACVSASSVAYVAPDGSGAGSACSSAQPCTLDQALSEAQITDIRLTTAPGTYTTAGATIARSVTIGGPIPSGEEPGKGRLKETDVAQIHVGSGLMVSGSGTAVALADLALTSGTADAVQCSAGAALSLDRVFVSANDKRGVVAQGCTLDIEHSQLHDNKSSAIDATDATITIDDNFVYANGTDMPPAGAINLSGATTGEVRYDTVAFNKASGGMMAIGGVSCALSGGATVNATDDLIVSNSGIQIPMPAAGQCNFGMYNYTGDAGGVHFQAGAAPYDLHLTMASPVENTGPGKKVGDNAAVVNVTHTTCTGIVDDIDGQPRPYPTSGPQAFCDRGADEYIPGQ